MNRFDEELRRAARKAAARLQPSGAVYPEPVDYGVKTQRGAEDVPWEVMCDIGVRLHVLAQLVWDYADTVINWAGKALGLEEVKETARKVRQLKQEYDRRRQPQLGSEVIEMERRAAEAFEAECGNDLKRLAFSLRNEISRAFPGLDPKTGTLIQAVQECQTMIDALRQWAQRSDAVVHSYGVWRHSVMYDEMVPLASMIERFMVGRKFESEARRLTASILLNKISKFEYLDHLV